MSDTREQPAYTVPPGFMSKMLDVMPKFVTGLVGSFLGISLAFVIVLKIGGMDVAFARVVNAFAAGLEAQMTQIGKSADKLASSIDTLNESMREVQIIVNGTRERLTILENQADSLSKRTEALEKWACSHEQRVARPEEFGSPLCK